MFDWDLNTLLQSDAKNIWDKTSCGNSEVKNQER